MGFSLYPRLDRREAAKLRDQLLSSRNGVVFDPAALEKALADPYTFPSTGGLRITEGTLLEMRAACLSALNHVRTDDQDFGVAFDLAVGRELIARTDGSRGEMGVPRVWDFLALVLLPDLAWLRISAGGAVATRGAGAKRRLVGGDRRHVLQKLWKRWTVFGPETVESGLLTEDDYVAMLERRLTLERPEIARRCAASIIRSGYRGSARREYTRVFMRHLVQMSGIVHIGEDDSEHLDAMFAHLHAETVAVLS